MCLLATLPARANGRFPQAERLVEDPADPSHLMVAGTYGLVTTYDHGTHWYFTCEAEFAGQSSYGGDPLLEIVAGGAALVDVQAFVGRTADGCSWAPTLGSLASAGTQSFDDFAVDRASGTTIVADATTFVDGAWTISLEQSRDAGVTWHPLGSPLPASLLFTVDLDPTDPTHIVATGLSAGRTGIFLSSVDNGQTWTSADIPNTNIDDEPYIAAIDPTNPSRIFVRTDSWITEDDGTLQSNDALLVSEDGGATFTTLLQKNARLFGFAISPDGSRIVAGYGDPKDPTYDVDPAVMGIYVADASDLAFTATPVVSGSVTCLTWTMAGLYECTAPAQSTSGQFVQVNFFESAAIALDGGVDFSAATSLMNLNDIVGPPPCCAATLAACNWALDCPSLGACGDGGMPLSCESTDAAAIPPASTAAHGASSGCASAGAATPRGAKDALWLSCFAALAIHRRRWRPTKRRPREASVLIVERCCRRAHRKARELRALSRRGRPL